MKATAVWAINDVIEKNKRVFKVPVYQRNYDWKINHCEKLFEDVLQAYREDKKHFIGTMVYLKGEKDSSQLQESLIIDGQQRITTIYIFLKAILDLAKEQNKVAVCSEIEDLLFNRHCEEKNKIKIKLIKTDEKQLRFLMYNQYDDLEKSSNIRLNYEFFKKKLQNLPDETYELGDILYGLKKLELIEISLDRHDGDDPQVIFESINSTGLALSLSDLIRNYLLMDIKKQDFLYEQYWLQIEQLLGYEKMEEFFIQFLNAKVRDNVSIQKAYQVFKKYSEDFKNSNEDLLKELRGYANFYAAFIGKNKVYDKKINKILNDFITMKQTTLYPFLFKVFEDHDLERINDDILYKILKLFQTYSLRRLICEIPSNSLKGFYKFFYGKCFKDGVALSGERYYETIRKALYAIQTKDKMIRDVEFKDALIHKGLYKKSVCKFVLLEIENEGKELLDGDSLSIEHILSQKENLSVWQNELGAAYQETYDKYLHTLGNLTLTGYNAEMSTKSFQKKKEELMNSQTKVSILNRDVINQTKWDKDAILRRANNLADILIRIFPLENVDSTIKEEQECWITLHDEIYPTKTNPILLEYYGDGYLVNSYSDVLGCFLQCVYKENPELLELLARQNALFGKATNPYLSYERNVLRKPEELLKSGIFYEKNLNVIGIMKFMRELVLKAELDPTEISICIK